MIKKINTKAIKLIKKAEAINTHNINNFNDNLLINNYRLLAKSFYKLNDHRLLISF